MAHYAIGDIQGCFDEFTLLLDKINFNHGTDTLWLVGDIVNRGPKSLEVLQFCMEHESSVRMVLGNHDLHLLAVGYGEGTVKRSDTITPILQHPDSKKMLEWLRFQPLLIKGVRHVMVHAGILPQWTIARAELLASETEAERTPFRSFSRRSTLAEHAEHAMPITGMVCFIIFQSLPYNSFLSIIIHIFPYEGKKSMLHPERKG